VITRFATLALLLAALPGQASEIPWESGDSVYIDEVTSLIIAGGGGWRAGYDVAVVRWDDDEYLDVIVAEPLADVEADEGIREDAGRIAVFLGPFDPRELGAEPGSPVTLDIEMAHLLIQGPALGRMGTRMLARPVGDDGPPLAVSLPGAVGLDDIPHGWTEAKLHGGEVWLLDPANPACQPPVADAEDCVHGKVWWDGLVTHDVDLNDHVISLPHDFGYELARMPDLDGDGVPELAITAGTTVFWDVLPALAPTVASGEVLVVSGQQVIDGLGGALTRAWRLSAGATDEWIRVMGNSIASHDEDDERDDIAIGSLAYGTNSSYAGAVFLVDPETLGEPTEDLTVSAGQYVSLNTDALQIQGHPVMPDDYEVYTLGHSVDIVAGGDLLVATATGWPATHGSTTAYFAVAELVWLPHALWAYDHGEAVSITMLEPWELIGDVNPVVSWTDPINYEVYYTALAVAEYWGPLLGDIWTAATECLPPVAPEDGAGQADCMLTFVRRLGWGQIALAEFPRGFLVPAEHGEALLLGEPLHDGGPGAAHVVTLPTDLWPGAPFHLEPGSPDIPTGDGWTVTSLLADGDALWLGHDLESADDLDGDGVRDLVVGAPGPLDDGSDEPTPGRVYVLLSTDYSDADGDGFSIADEDCDDADPANFPGQHEVCDGRDNDCDGVADDLLDFDKWYWDGDRDLHGDPEMPLETCDGPPADGWVGWADDCDDSDPTVHPGADELCDGLDNDCDGVVPADERDGDGDGYVVCEDWDGAAASIRSGGDCDDSRPGSNPAAAEVCDDRDNDCDDRVDDSISCPSGCGCTDAGHPLLAAAPLSLLLGLGRRRARHPRRSRGGLRPRSRR